jgi:FKBP-type peptidyl-prolyl cis-trans isomerase FkpA
MALVVSCGQERNEEKRPVVDTPAENLLNTENDKQSYSIGVSFGKYLKRALDENQKIDIKLSENIVMMGVKDTLTGDEKLAEDEVKAIMQAFDQLTRTKHAEMAKANAEKAIKLGQEYKAKNAKKEGINTTDSGIQYQVLTLGNGAKPTVNDRVKVHYRGTLIDGTEFDSSYSRKQPATFGVNKVIKGWTEGLQLMPVGSKFSFTIPSELAYGERATGKIKANSTLIFVVDLLEIVTAKN